MTKIQKEVTENIVKALESGVASWIKPWDSCADGVLVPSNHSTLKPYRGINVLNLGWKSMMEGWPNTWGTFNMWRKLSNDLNDKLEKKAKKNGEDYERQWYGVKKEQESTPIFFYKMIQVKDKDDEDKTKSFPILKMFSGFNISQTNMPVNTDAKKDKRPITEIEKEIDEMIKRHNVEFRENGNSAFFNYNSDFICVPKRSQFKTIEDRASTILHELTHWTGHPSRLNRDMRGGFGSEDYAKEELVAELGSAILCQTMGLPLESLQHTEYIGSWIKRLKKDDGYKYLFSASAKAQSAVDFLLNTDFVKGDE